EAGKLDLDCIAFSLRDSVNAAMKTLALRADQKGVELMCEIASETPDALLGDAGRLRQVLVNLAGNAIKFTERGEIVASVSVESMNEQSVELHFAVRDTGIGIPDQKLARVFQAFEQADISTSRRYGGTGLGLAISAQLVEMMRGRMRVESEVDRGSTFHFTARFELSGALPAVEQREQVDLTGLRVVIADDNATNRRILEVGLAGLGMAITVAESGPAALEALRQANAAAEPFDLLLLDYQMPGMDGLRVAEEIRQDALISETSIIMLTASTQHRIAASCKELRLTGYLTKPVSHSELTDAISSWARGSALTQKSSSADSQDHSTQSQLRILLAEDNKVNQRLAMRLLQKKGHSVVL